MVGVYVKLVQIPVQSHNGARPFTMGELEKVDNWFRTSCKNNTSKAYYAILRDTGARGFEELSLLTAHDIDWDKKTVTMRSRKGSLGDSWERVVWLTEVSERAFAWLANSQENRLITHSMSRKFRDDFNQMRSELFPDDFNVKPYSLRHTFAMRLKAQGLDLPVIARAMGHRSIQTTLLYLHPTPNDRGDILRALCTSKTPSNSCESKDAGSDERSGGGSSGS